MGSRKIAKNVTSSLALQICSVICGFIVPYLILNCYGSEVNGLVNSISQFLSFISLMELGVGAVVQSALYKPLAENDHHQINSIITSAEKFFRIIGIMLTVYTVILIVGYPFISNQKFGYVYTATLILAISVSTFSQYYFGVVDRLLLVADQRGYVQYNAQIITLILNTLACVVLINLGCSIHVVKLTTSLIYLARPIYLRAYVKKHYTINRREYYTEEPIRQKWNGIAQHVSSVVLNNTDTIVLTVMSTLSNVSIYSVYNLVVSGLKQLFEVSTSGVEAALGELWAKQKFNEVKALHNKTEWVIHTLVTYVFACAAILIVPFVTVYTRNVTDAKYEQPLFALLIVLAHTVHCYRLPYHMMIKASGHYKQTQKCYIVATVINLMVSILAVRLCGLIGVAIGTLVAMLYQTLWMANYNMKNLVPEKWQAFLKQLLADALSFSICYCLSSGFVKLQSKTYLSWICVAFATAILVGCIMGIVNFIMYRSNVIGVLNKIRERLPVK